MLFTLQTIRHRVNAEKVVGEEDPPELKVERYHRPGAPCAGLMVYARLSDGAWVACGWIREKDKDIVMNLSAGGSVESLTCVLQESYIKKGYHVIKVNIF